MIASKGDTGNKNSAPRRGAGRFALWAGVVAAAVVAVVAVIATKERGKELQSEETRKGLIAEVEPEMAQTPEPEPEVKDYSKLDNLELRRLPESETNNLTEAQVNYWKMFHPWPPPDKNQPKANRGAYHIFESRADNEIAFVLATEPGTMVIGNRQVGPDFEQRFLKSIERPIVVSEDDSDYEKELKRAVIEAKLELKDALDRGEDICKIMDDARSELQRMARYKAQLEKEATILLHRKEMTAEEAEDMIRAVNVMLEENGIAPIELNSMSRLAMKYQNLLNKETEE